MNFICHFEIQSKNIASLNILFAKWYPSRALIHSRIFVLTYFPIVMVSSANFSNRPHIHQIDKRFGGRFSNFSTLLPTKIRGFDTNLDSQSLVNM